MFNRNPDQVSSPRGKVTDSVHPQATSAFRVKLAGLARRIGDRLFLRPDAVAGAHGWTSTPRWGGLARTYRDPNLARLATCPECNGAGAQTWPPVWCPRCAGRGRILPATELAVPLAVATARGWEQ
jgi:hypothetical protein